MAGKFEKSKRYSSNLPWCQDEVDKLGPAVMEWVLEQESFLRRWAQKWFENLNFIYGNQNIKWSQRFDFAVEVDFLRRESPLSQKSQTNIARVVCEALAAMIYADLPGWDPEAMDESSLKGKRFQKITEKLLECYMERLCCDKEFAMAALCYVTYGIVGARVDHKKNRGQLLEIPQWKKVQAPMFSTMMTANNYINGLLEIPTPVLGPDGQPVMTDRWEPVVDENGRQVVNKMFAGDAGIDILTPFEYRREIGVPFHKSRWFEHIRLLDYDEWLSEFSDVEGKTEHFSSVLPEQADKSLHQFAVRHFMRLKYITPPSLLDVYKRQESVIKGSMFRNKIMVVEHFDRPNDEMWPQGRRVVVANGRCTHVTTPSYSTNKIDGWHPFCEASWMSIAPSSMPTGPMNDVIAKNKETNAKDSLIATSLRRNLGSMMLVKTSSGLDPQKISGEPGQIHEVNDPTNAAMWLTDSNPISPVLQQLKQLDKDEIYEVSGAMDALRGDRSKGVSAGYALKQLQEREERRLTPARKAFEGFISSIGEKLVACIKQNAIQLDENVMGFLRRSAAGEFSPQDVVAFLSTPVDYGVDVKVKSGSMAPKSKASQKADLQELSKGPLGQRLAQDADVMDTYLRFFDAETLRDKSAGHRDRARMENEAYMDLERLGVDNEGVVLPKVLFEDDDDIHIAEHTDWIVKNSAALMSNELLLQQVLTHNEQHRIQQKEKKGEVLPGTAQQVPGMIAQSRQQQPPTIPMIYYDSVQKSQAQTQQKLVDQQTGEQKAPRAPREAAPAGQGGPGPISTSAPSENTPSATIQGGIG